MYAHLARLRSLAYPSIVSFTHTHNLNDFLSNLIKVSLDKIAHLARLRSLAYTEYSLVYADAQSERFFLKLD